MLILQTGNFHDLDSRLQCWYSFAHAGNINFLSKEEILENKCFLKERAEEFPLWLSRLRT